MSFVPPRWAPTLVAAVVTSALRSGTRPCAILPRTHSAPSTSSSTASRSGTALVRRPLHARLQRAVPAAGGAAVADLGRRTRGDRDARSCSTAWCVPGGESGPLGGPVVRGARARRAARERVAGVRARGRRSRSASLRALQRGRTVVAVALAVAAACPARWRRRSSRSSARGRDAPRAGSAIVAGRSCLWRCSDCCSRRAASSRSGSRPGGRWRCSAGSRCSRSAASPASATCARCIAATCGSRQWRLVPNPLGGNMTRLGSLFGGPVLLALAASRAPHAGARAGRVPRCSSGLAWQVITPIRQTSESLGDPSTERSYYEPLKSMAAAHGAERERIEIPHTFSHWETAYVSPRFSLARGWLRQLDVERNDLFYDGRLDHERYRALAPRERRSGGSRCLGRAARLLRRGRGQPGRAQDPPYLRLRARPRALARVRGAPMRRADAVGAAPARGAHRRSSPSHSRSRSARPGDFVVTRAPDARTGGSSAAPAAWDAPATGPACGPTAAGHRAGVIGFSRPCRRAAIRRDRRMLRSTIPSTARL